MEGNNCIDNDSARIGAGGGGGEEEEEDLEALKKRISSHPLYGLLIERHLNCLKVGLGDIGELSITSALDQATQMMLTATISGSTDLDNFMEAYCMALDKLKEAMEKPLQETATFINSMFIELDELCVTQDSASPLP